MSTLGPPELAADAPLYCPGCDYDLRGLERETGATCPECGQGVDDASLRVAAVPWEGRGERGWWGRVGSFWRTAARATFRPKRLARAASLPVRYDDAAAFRRVLCGWLMVGVVLPGVVWWAGPWGGGGEWVQTAWVLQPTLLVTLGASVMVGAWLFLLGITGVHSYWFHPRHLDVERQNRAVALSLYAAAPMAWVPLVWLPLAGIAAVVAAGDGARYDGYAPLDWLLPVSFVCGLLVILLVALPVLAMWAMVLRLAMHAARREVVARVVLMLALPVLWGVLGALTLVVIPLLTGYVWLLVPLV